MHGHCPVLRGPGWAGLGWAWSFEQHSHLVSCSTQSSVVQGLAGPGFCQGSTTHTLRVLGQFMLYLSVLCFPHLQNENNQTSEV